MGERVSYPPIADYGIIGNLRTAALVGRDGSIDWCCFPRFDSPSIYAGILDHDRGGHFRIAPAGAGTGDQRYVPETNVLQTHFRTDGGLLTVTDWMPLRGKLDGARDSESEPEILRLVECEGSGVELEIEWAPRFDYARERTTIERVRGGAVARGGRHVASLSGLPVPGEIAERAGSPVLRVRLELETGSRIALRNRWGGGESSISPEQDTRFLQETIEAWRGWVRRGNAACGDWAGEWQDLVVRSSLALKLLIHDETGAIVAAPTTSLPEEIGGSRNWDYRYSWIRDAAQTADALFAVGHAEDAKDYVNWVERTARGTNEQPTEMRLMYNLDGEHELPEIELDHLEGYRKSRPVRVGNAAADQRQLDIYGELIQAGYEVVRAGEGIPADIRDFLPRVADAACSSWHHPDHGIWEIRGPGRHYTHSKVMVWVALDRAIQLVKRHEFEGDVPRWEEAARNVRRTILEHGYDEELGSFIQSFGRPVLDASSLLIPRHELLPPDDPRVQGTIDRVLERLTVNGLVYRYRADDGLEGEEGAFGLCTFWLVDALALSGRLDEAWGTFEGMVAHANHLGLYSEEIAPSNGEFLGNLPQAFTHIGLINSVLYLNHAEGREIPAPSLVGTAEHRAEADRDH
jgi:GH15 family glucan-1,4-alpha-glucosidase